MNVGIVSHDNAEACASLGAAPATRISAADIRSARREFEFMRARGGFRPILGLFGWVTPYLYLSSDLLAPLPQLGHAGAFWGSSIGGPSPGGSPATILVLEVNRLFGSSRIALNLEGTT